MIGRIRRALLSVSDKDGLLAFAKALQGAGVELISTGGTYNLLSTHNIKAKKVSEVTGFPEILDGRVKTLHPYIFGGILARRELSNHVSTLEEHNIPFIDVVVVNLYPFEKTATQKDVCFEDVIEQIDIGGPSLLRAAAKNFKDVVVVCDPAEYDNVIKEMTEEDNTVSEATRLRLARKVFEHTSHYDVAIAGYLEKSQKDCNSDEDMFPPEIALNFERISPLRYGENPHQKAAVYRTPGEKETSVISAEQLQGKEISYNNINDLEGALELVRAFEEPAVAIIKHSNPCGVAQAGTLADAYKKALECDPVSAFGGIVAANREIDKETAQAVTSIFVEAVIAPSFTEEALQVFAKKKNVRVMRTGSFTPQQPRVMWKSVVGGMLVQERDLGMLRAEDLQCVTDAKPTQDDIKGLLFAWKVVKMVKSNAIVYTTRDTAVGIGAGQMSRVDSAKIGIQKAQSPIEGTYMASDAFFPFRDSIDFAAEHKVHAIIQPGGSIRDKEVVDACNEHGLIMVFTGMRHFRH